MRDGLRWLAQDRGVYPIFLPASQACASPDRVNPDEKPQTAETHPSMDNSRQLRKYHKARGLEKMLVSPANSAN